MATPQVRYEQMVARLRERAIRLTPQRLAILRILAASTGHPSVEQIHRAILREFPTTSLATVYKTIGLLKLEGEVLELGFSDLGNRYDGNRPDPHPHVICTRCGAIVDPDDHDLQALAERIMRETGFHIVSHRLDFYGLCPACQKRR